MCPRPSRVGASRPAAPARPRRADALRNHGRLLDVADAVFAARGVSASTDQIARRAGVGIGTLFRHFPTKEALLEAVLVRRLQRLAGEVEGLLVTQAPGEAFFTAFGRAVADAPGKLALTDALGAGGVQAGGGVMDARRRLRASFALLLGRAQEAGAVRTDVGVDEVFALLAGASRMTTQAAFNRGVVARAVGVILDGLRPARGLEPRTMQAPTRATKSGRGR